MMKRKIKKNRTVTKSDSNDIAEAKVATSLTEKIISFVNNDKKEVSEMDKIQTDISPIKAMISNLSIKKTVKSSTKSAVIPFEEDISSLKSAQRLSEIETRVFI